MPKGYNNSIQEAPTKGSIKLSSHPIYPKYETKLESRLEKEALKRVVKGSKYLSN